MLKDCSVHEFKFIFVKAQKDFSTQPWPELLSFDPRWTALCFGLSPKNQIGMGGWDWGTFLLNTKRSKEQQCILFLALLDWFRKVFHSPFLLLNWATIRKPALQSSPSAVFLGNGLQEAWELFARTADPSEERKHQTHSTRACFLLSGLCPTRSLVIVASLMLSINPHPCPPY